MTAVARVRNMTYQLVATCAGIEISRQVFNALDKANDAWGPALVLYPDCEIRLTNGETVIASAGVTPRGPLVGSRHSRETRRGSAGSVL
jgi:hypothetical protein